MDPSHVAQGGIGKVMAALNAVVGLAYLLLALFVTQIWWQVLFAAGWFGLALGWLATTRWRRGWRPPSGAQSS